MGEGTDGDSPAEEDKEISWRRLCETSSAGLDVQQKDHSAIVADFEKGRAHILFHLSLQLAHWQSHPWEIYAASFLRS